MADEEAKAESPEAPEKKGGLPLAAIIVVAAVMLIEAVVIAAVFMMAGGPSEVQAESNVEDVTADLEQPVPVLVLADKLQNTKSGQNFLYDTEIYATVKAGQRELVEGMIEAKRAQLAREVMVIFRRAEPAHLHEPELSTLTRQIKAVLMKKFGNTPGSDEPYLLDVLIAKCTEFPAD